MFATKCQEHILGRSSLRSLSASLFALIPSSHKKRKQWWPLVGWATVSAWITAVLPRSCFYILSWFALSWFSFNTVWLGCLVSNYCIILILVCFPLGWPCHPLFDLSPGWLAGSASCHSLKFQTQNMRPVGKGWTCLLSLGRTDNNWEGKAFSLDLHCYCQGLCNKKGPRFFKKGAPFPNCIMVPRVWAFIFLRLQ